MELAPCKVLGGARRGGAARPSRLWRRGATVEAVAAAQRSEARRVRW